MKIKGGRWWGVGLGIKGFRVWGIRFMVKGLGLKISGVEFAFQILGLRGYGFKVKVSVPGFGFQI